MKIRFTLALGLVLAGALSSTTLADGHENKAAKAAVKARQATMDLYVFNLGILGAMAKGAVDYDADAAKAAAGNLAVLSSMNQMAIWPPGSDTDTLGDVTRALPAIWAADSRAFEAGMALATSAAALSNVAGDGLDALRGGIGAVGKSCGGCHDTYRQPK